MESQASVARGATSFYAANVVVMIANALYFLVLTNILHSTLDVGIVTALNLLIWFLVTVCILAQPVMTQSPIPAPLAVLKFLPELLAKNAKVGAAKVFNSSLAYSGSLSGVIAGILILSPDLVIPLIGGAVILPDYIRLSAVDVLLLSIGQICLGTLIALGDMKRASVYIVSWSLGRYALASILLTQYAIVGVLMGFIIGDGILLAIALHRSIQSISHGSSSSAGFSFAELTRYSIVTFLSALMGFTINQADKLFTLASQGLPGLAVYNVAMVASSLAGFAPYALLIVLLPALSSLRASNRIEESRNLIRAYSRYVSLAVIPIAIGFASLMEVALRIFGPEYLNGLVPAVIVTAATGLTAVGSVFAAELLAFGELKWYTTANLLGLVSLFVVSAIATPLLGLNGPALGRVSLLIVALIFYGLAARRKGFFEIDMRAFLSASGASAFMGVVVFLLLSAFRSFYMKLAFVPLLVLLGAFIYIASLRLLRVFDPRDMEFALGIAPRRVRWIIPKIGKLIGVRGEDN